METLEAMGTRRSIRYFYPWKYVEDEKIQTILEAARRASHWGNVFVWRCIVVDKKKASPEIITAAEEGGYNQVQVQQAPLILYFVVDRAKWAGWKDVVVELYELKAINPSHGWSHQMIEEIATTQGRGLVAHVQALDFAGESAPRCAAARPRRMPRAIPARERNSATQPGQSPR